MPGAWEYEQAIDNVSNWYNTSADNVWNVVNDYNLTPEQTQGLIPTIDSFLYGEGHNSGYTAVKYADGSVASWNNVAALQTNNANAVEQAVNSNAGAISQQTYQLPATTDYSGTGGTFKASKGVTGGGNAVKVMTQVSTAVAAAGLGIKLGKVVDNALYHALPYFFDDIDVTFLNPETWNSITVDMSDSGWEGTLKRAFNAILGLDSSTGKSQMYIDAEAAAYLAMYLDSKGVFASGGGSITSGDAWAQSQSWYSDITFPIAAGAFGRQSTSSGVIATSDADRCGYFLSNVQQGAWVALDVSATKSTFTYTRSDGQYPQTVTANYRIINGKDVYFFQWSYNNSDWLPLITPTTEWPAYVQAANMAYVLLYGTYSGGGGGVEGITDQDGATQPDFTGCETPADYKQALQTQYPDMWQNAITQNVAQPDGTVVQRTYVPVGTPTATGTQDTQPTTDPEQSGQSQSDTAVDPATTTQTIIDTVVKYIENLRTPDTPKTDNPPDTGDGNTPPVVAPTGSASALWSVYNPTQAQLNSFGAWLWSSSFIDQVLKLFNNPMQSIIGVHKIFATPAISGTGNIVVGYLDSGVSSNIVGAQYTTINCGSVSVREQFGNVFDYTDTQVRLYLPFIGIVDLDTSDVMRGTVSVVYHVDVITGACLAEVRVTRDGSGGTLYQFAGDASVRYPISSGSYMGIVAGIASAVGGVASAIATGGATLPLAAGAVAGGLSGAKTNVQHSGSFSGNAGAMGGKKPYLIIERPQTLIAEGYGNYQGKGANVIRTVSQCSGYFKMSDVHTESISGASAEEVQAIKTALESGVIK